MAGGEAEEVGAGRVPALLGEEVGEEGGVGGGGLEVEVDVLAEFEEGGGVFAGEEGGGFVRGKDVFGGAGAVAAAGGRGGSRESDRVLFIRAD